MMKTPLIPFLILALLLPMSHAPASKAGSSGSGASNAKREQDASEEGADARSEFARREAAYRANNLGVALLEQFKHREGAEEFRRALALWPRMGLARTNLAIALYNVPDLPAAEEAARAAVEISPGAPQPRYILGLIARQLNRPEEAIEHFRFVNSLDPRDTGANVNLGQLYVQQRNYEAAIKHFRAATEAEPYNGTAIYNLATALLRTGKREEGQRLINRFQSLRESGAATIIGQNYLEQGRYAEAVTSTGAEPELVSKETPEVSFVDSTKDAFAATATDSKRGARAKGSAARRGRSGARERSGGRRATPSQRDSSARASSAVTERDFASGFNGGITLFDFDDDGDLDLLDLAPARTRLYRNERGRFIDVTSEAGDLGRASDGVNIGAVAGDYDNDGRADLFVLRYGRSALFRNEGGGRFSNRTESARVPTFDHLSLASAFADVDHDGDLDIFIAGFARLKSSCSGVVLSEGAPNLLLRNNGDGTFTEAASAAGVAGGSHRAVAIVPTDYDNRRDVDLFVVNSGAPPTLYRNMRDGTFRDVTIDAGLDARSLYTSAAAGDVNKDEFTDFYLPSADEGGTFALSDARGSYKLVSIEKTADEAKADEKAGGDAKTSKKTGEAKTNEKTGEAKANMKTDEDEKHASHLRPSARDVAQFLDYDNDGLLDLVTLEAFETGARLNVRRNTGAGWADATKRAVVAGEAISSQAGRFAAGVLASGDADNDGDTDLFLRSREGSLVFMRNDGGNRNRSVRVRLSGKVSNRSGIGSKIEGRAGSLQQKYEFYSAAPAPAPADVIFGMGKRESADAVRVLWPSGVVQAETGAVEVGIEAETTARVEPGTLSVTELDRKPSSCPYLYTWNGERFEFITDFMGGGELGYWVAPGVRASPDPEEYVRIRGDQLVERGGRFELRVTNELEEALFLDRLRLMVVSHPEGVEVYPNEGLGNPTSSEFKIYTTRDARPPRAARDEHGHDVLARISRIDRTYLDDFSLLPIRGYAREHALTLDLGSDDEGRGAQRRGAKRGRASRGLSNSSTERTLLLMNGWTDYAFSSDNVAAAQMGLSLRPPRLQVRDANGEWRTVIENIGIPVGRPQTVTVDLTGKFLSESREVRILTNMRIYWDQVLVERAGEDVPVRIETLDATVADLRWRGFSAELAPDGREPYIYDYARVSAVSPWKVFPGRYTREGDVRELLLAVDDMFVVSRPGDEVALSFDATALEPLPEGWTRTFLFHTDGFSKEMDINSSSPHELGPLPFHGMKEYPYSAPESFPSTPAHLSYLERYNTRVVASPLEVLGGSSAFSARGKGGSYSGGRR